MSDKPIKQRVRELLDARNELTQVRATKIYFTPEDKKEIELADPEVLGSTLAAEVKDRGYQYKNFFGLEIIGWDAEETKII